MLSVGPRARRFSPSQNIRVAKSAFWLFGNVHYRQNPYISSQSGHGGEAHVGSPANRIRAVEDEPATASFCPARVTDGTPDWMRSRPRAELPTPRTTRRATRCPASRLRRVAWSSLSPRRTLRKNSRGLPNTLQGRSQSRLSSLKSAPCEHVSKWAEPLQRCGISPSVSLPMRREAITLPRQKPRRTFSSLRSCVRSWRRSWATSALVHFFLARSPWRTRKLRGCTQCMSERMALWKSWNNLTRKLTQMRFSRAELFCLPSCLVCWWLLSAPL